MEQRMPWPCAGRRCRENASGGIFDDLVQTQVGDAVSASVWQRKGLVAMGLVLARHIRSASGVLVDDTSSRLSALSPFGFAASV